MATSKQAEADRLIDEAIKHNTITAAQRATWQVLFNDNFDSTRALLAAARVSRSALGTDYVPSTPQSRGDVDLAAAYAKITGQPFDAVQSRPRQPVPRNTNLDVPNIPVHITTADEVNARIESDPDMHRALWNLGVREGLSAPPTRITWWKDTDAPDIVMNADGTGQWVNPSRERSIAEMDKQIAQQAALREQQAERDKEAYAAYIDMKGH